MANRELNGLGGRLRIEVRSRDGRLIEARRVDNLITAVGKNLLAHFFSGRTEGRPELYIAVGGGGNPPDEGNSALQTPLDEAPASVTDIAVKEEEGSQRAIATVSATFKADASVGEQALSEAGILIKLPTEVDLGDVSSKEVLYNRVVFPVVTRTGNLELSFTWEVLF